MRTFYFSHSHSFFHPLIKVYLPIVLAPINIWTLFRCRLYNKIVFWFKEVNRYWNWLSPPSFHQPWPKLDLCSIDDMNYDQIFRSLPYSTFAHGLVIVLLLLSTSSSLVEGKSDLVKKATDVLGDEKRVFDVNFGNNKNYEIDDCIPLAFGDFNADKIIDIFCRNTKGNQLFESRPQRPALSSTRRYHSSDAQWWSISHVERTMPSESHVSRSCH